MIAYHTLVRDLLLTQFLSSSRESRRKCHSSVATFSVLTYTEQTMEASSDFSEHQMEFEELLMQKQQLEDHITTSTACFEKNLEELERRRQSADSLHDQIQKRISEAVAMLQNTSKECELATAAYTEMEGKISEHRRKSLDAVTIVQEKQTELSKLKAEIAIAIEERALVQKELEEAKASAKTEIEQGRQKISEICERLIDVGKEQSEIMNETETLIRQKKQIEDEILSEKAKLEQLKLETLKQQEIFEQTRKNVEAEQQRLEMMKNEAAEKEKDLVVKKEEAEAMDKQKHELEVYISKVNKEHEEIAGEMAKLLQQMGEKEKALHTNTQKTVKGKKK